MWTVGCLETEEGRMAIAVSTELLGAFAEVRQQLAMLDTLSKAITNNSAAALIGHPDFQRALQQVRQCWLLALYPVPKLLATQFSWQCNHGADL